MLLNSPAANSRVPRATVRKSLRPECRLVISRDTPSAPDSAKALKLTFEGSCVRSFKLSKNSPIRVPTVALCGIKVLSRRLRTSDFDFANENEDDEFCNCKSKNWSNALVMPPMRTPKPLVLDKYRTSELAALTSSIEASRREYPSVPTLAIF